jgi:predicted DsbA family dithiol-disulfide isomerase
MHIDCHLAKKFNYADALKELKGYLTDGKEDINDLNALKNMALEVGLNSESIDEVLQTNAFADEATEHVEAQNIGVQGVLFFVF